MRMCHDTANAAIIISCKSRCKMEILRMFCPINEENWFAIK
jgi:hypothetical protein